MEPYTIYSKPNCAYCDQAKALLEQRGKPYVVVTLDIGQPKSSSEQYITKTDFLRLIPTARTVPQIMGTTAEGVHYIGGFQELKSLLAA
jgi:glutaredoxin